MRASDADDSTIQVYLFTRQARAGPLAGAGLKIIAPTTVAGRQTEAPRRPLLTSADSAAGSRAGQANPPTAKNDQQRQQCPRPARSLFLRDVAQHPRPAFGGALVAQEAQQWPPPAGPNPLWRRLRLGRPICSPRVLRQQFHSSALLIELPPLPGPPEPANDRPDPSGSVPLSPDDSSSTRRPASS